jgi:hypothetical protein
MNNDDDDNDDNDTDSDAYSTIDIHDDHVVPPLLREWNHPHPIHPINHPNIVAPAVVAQVVDHGVTAAASESDQSLSLNATATSSSHDDVTVTGSDHRSLHHTSLDDTTATSTAASPASGNPDIRATATPAPHQCLLQQSSQSPYTYPVATFVRDLVRTGMDQMQIYASAEPSHVQSALTVTAAATSATRSTLASRGNSGSNSNNSNNGGVVPAPHNMSIRSEGNERSGGLSRLDLNEHEHSEPFASATVRTLNDLDSDDNAEYILVDGDLIAVPHDMHMNEEEREDLEYQLRKQCQIQPSRVRRGVRKIGKWMKKRRASRSSHPRSHSQDHDVHGSGSLDDRNFDDAAFEAGAGVGVGGTAGAGGSASIGAATTTTESRRGRNRTLSRDANLSMPLPMPATSDFATGMPSGDDDPSQLQLHERHEQLQQQLLHYQQQRNTQIHQQQQQQQSNPKPKAVSPKRKNRRQRRSWRRTGSDLDNDGMFAEEQEQGDGQGYGSNRNRSGEDQSLLGPGFDHHNNRFQQQGGLSVMDGLHYNNNYNSSNSLGSSSVAAASAATAGIPSMMPIHETSAETSTSSRQSVTASFVGTCSTDADQVVLEAGVLPASMAAAEAYIFEGDDEKKDDGGTIMMSLLPPDADYKVDKAAAPDVESMLRRAAHETVTDLAETSVPESCLLSPLRFRRRGKSDGSSVPLSQAVPGDLAVHNDILKIVMVAAPHVDKSTLARAIRETKKLPRKRATLGVDVHTWQPDETLDVNIQIWDVQGATTVHCRTDSANMGTHAGTQSLFFSAKSLYLLVWDLAASNLKTMRHEPGHVDDSDDEEYDGDDDFMREEANRQADRALYADIQANILSWVDCIASRGPHSGILPIAVIPSGMAEEEVKRRCEMMQDLLEQHVKQSRFAGDLRAPKLLTGADSMLCVDYSTELGVKKVQEMILSIATDSSRSVFDHVGTPVPPGTLGVLEVTRRLKQDHKLILLDHVLGELDSILSVEEVIEALHFLSSIGEILYFGTADAVADDDDVLSRYIILSRKWLVSALSCILRNDMHREVVETRRFMNMQCIYSDQKYSEDDITKALVSGTASSCPLLSDSDANMLWQSMSFMREAADRHSQLAESSTTTPTMFYFLERLLVHSGIFLPLETSGLSLDHSNVFFVPSLLAQADPRDIWTYKSSESWMTTLCHSWLFRDGAPSHLMEHVTVSVLKGLYEFSRSFNGGRRPDPPHRSQTVPESRSSLHDFLEEHDDETIGRVKINHIMCWKSSLLVKISCVIADQESGELRESFVEVFVSVVDQSSSHCVASDAMRASMQRVVVSGKGLDGHHARKLWKGGYQVVLDTVRQSLDSYTNVDSQVVCPECLAHSSPHSASTWSWDSVLAAAESGSSVVRCIRGHRVNSNLICGTCTLTEKLMPSLESAPSLRTVKAVSEVLPTVVLVGLWDTHSKSIRNVGSGFFVDKKLGLIVTAGHILFNMKEGREFGAPYYGLQDAKVVIGVIPDGNDGHDAVFRYFADVVAEDIHNVDACVLRITTRLMEDVNDVGDVGAEIVIDDMPKEQLKSLKITGKVEIEESVRILGFNQGGEGVFEQGKHVNRSADFARGYVVKKFRPSFDDDGDDSSSHSSDSSSQFTFSPREEIVIMCPTISGHSGGPCVNDDGKVVGILSRADPVDRQRCYLVPSAELRTLVNQAKKHSTRPTMLKSMQSL